MCVVCFLTGEWSSPAINGTPPPLEGFTLTVCSNRVVLIGGKSEGGVFNNDVYSFDIGRKVSEYCNVAELMRLYWSALLDAYRLL